MTPENSLPADLVRFAGLTLEEAAADSGINSLTRRALFSEIGAHIHMLMERNAELLAELEGYRLIAAHRLNIQHHAESIGKISVWNSSTSDKWVYVLTHEYPSEAAALAAAVQKFDESHPLVEDDGWKGHIA